MAQARVLTERQLKKVLHYCDQNKHPTRNKAMLLMTHFAGLRVGEVAALTVSDVLTIEGASSHSGRRGFITNLADKGIHVRVLMALAGHQSIATTQRYIDLNPKMIRTAVEMI